jgi:hypothetical protein
VRAVVEHDGHKPGATFGVIPPELGFDNSDSLGRAAEDFGGEDFPACAGIAEKCEKGGEKCCFYNNYLNIKLLSLLFPCSLRLKLTL